jgi:hypothetical protein
MMPAPKCHRHLDSLTTSPKKEGHRLGNADGLGESGAGAYPALPVSTATREVVIGE